MHGFDAYCIAYLAGDVIYDVHKLKKKSGFIAPNIQKRGASTGRRAAHLFSLFKNKVSTYVVRTMKRERPMSRTTTSDLLITIR